MVSEIALPPEALKQTTTDPAKDRQPRRRTTPVRAAEFDFLQVVGAGAFGVVRLCQKKDTGEVFALKQMNKAEMVRKNKVRHACNEKDALSRAYSDWVVGLHCTFQDESFLYMVMDYLPGGDLMTYLQRKGRFSELETRFYIGELVQAVDYVHTSLRIIHRDIKPDNVVLDARGHVHLVDFGLCAREVAMEPAASAGPMLLGTPHGGVAKATAPPPRARLRSLVGTPDYAAPEVYLQGPVGRECDWWSVGIVAYEMLFGRTPFADDRHDPKVIALRVQRWRQYLRLPLEPSVGEPARKLVLGLLCDAQDRLTAEDIREHRFFLGLDFEKLRSMEPPIKPVVRNPLDTSNFDDFATEDFQFRLTPPCQASPQSSPSFASPQSVLSQAPGPAGEHLPAEGRGDSCELEKCRLRGEDVAGRTCGGRDPRSGAPQKEAVVKSRPVLRWLAHVLAAPALLVCSPLLGPEAGGYWKMIKA